MDPKKAIQDLVDSILVHDFDEAENTLNSLALWVARGGFMPESVHITCDCEGRWRA